MNTSPDLSNDFKRSLSSLLEEYRQDCWYGKISEENIHRYNRCLFKMEKFFMQHWHDARYRSVPELTRRIARLMEDWHAEAMTKWKAESVRNFINYSNSFWNWCARKEYLDIHPGKWMKRLDYGPPPPPPKYITYDEYEQLRDGSKGTEMHWFLVCSYHTALRPADVCRLKWVEVDMQNLTITVAPGKTAKWGISTGPIGFAAFGEVHECLKVLWEEHLGHVETMPYLSQYVSIDLAERHRMDIVTNGFKRVMKNAPNVRRELRSYDLRRTALSNLVNAGNNSALVSRIAGHTNPKTMMKYIRVNGDGSRAAAARALEYAKQFSAPAPQLPSPSNVIDLKPAVEQPQPQLETENGS